MPEGVMEWFDPSTGTGRIAKDGHRFTVGTEDVPRAAQVAGARVHFDVDRHQPGRARNVTSRPGGRSRPRHHGVGRQTGARHPDAKGRVSGDRFERPLVDRDVHPEKVAAAWARHVTSGDLVAAVALCAPTVVLHTTAGDVSGSKHVSEALERWPYAGTHIDPVHVKGEADFGTTRMTWPGWGPDRTVVVHVEHGEVVDVRIDGAGVASEEGPGEVAVELGVAGAVPEQAKGYALEKMEHVIARGHAPVLFARVKLRHLGDPAAHRPAQAEGLLDVNGRAIRAHAAEATMTEAIDELTDRLRQRSVGQPHWSRTEGMPPEPGEWRRGNRPSPPVGWFERPPDERRLVRHKTISDESMTVDEAVFDMDLLDYDFYLFNDLASGQDCVLRRNGDGGVELQVLRPADFAPPVTRTPVAVRAGAPATLTVDEARAWLELTAEPMVFFADSTTGRGCVLYRRYDGHLGLVTPSG